MAGFESIELHDTSSQGDHTLDTTLKSDRPHYIRIVGPPDEEGNPLWFRLVNVSRIVAADGTPSYEKLVDMASTAWNFEPSNTLIVFRPRITKKKPGQKAWDEDLAMANNSFIILDDRDIVDCFEYCDCDTVDAIVKVRERLTVKLAKSAIESVKRVFCWSIKKENKLMAAALAATLSYSLTSGGFFVYLGFKAIRHGLRIERIPLFGRTLNLSFL